MGTREYRGCQQFKVSVTGIITSLLVLSHLQNNNCLGLLQCHNNNNTRTVWLNPLSTPMHSNCL